MRTSDTPAVPEADRTLEPDSRTLREWVDRAMERIVSHLESLPDQPAGYPPEALGSLDLRREPLPETGTELESLLDHLFEHALPMTYNTASPGYLAYIPGGGLFQAALGELIANAINRYVGVWVAAPLLVQIESDVVGWLAEIVGLPTTSRGILTTGGSMANLTAIVTARRERLPENFLDGVIYISDQAHHSVLKSALIAGFPSANVVSIPTDDRFCLQLPALASRVRADRSAGRTPFMVVASAGTTNTGAVDDLEAVAALAERERLWFHVDAAYGGFFRLTEAGRVALRGIERADSVILNPHKGLFLPYGTGALLVRDGPALRRSHSVQADYMPPMQESGTGEPRIDFCEHGLELSRGFRGLRVWLPLKLHGLGPFRRNLEEKLALAQHAADVLREIEGIEIVAEPQLSVVAFRLARSGLGVEQLDGLNRRLLGRILESGRVWLSGVSLGGCFTLRICVLHFRTHRDRIDECLELIRSAVREV